MATFTPSNLYTIGVGSSKLYVAEVNAGKISGTDYWTSYIPDIISVMAVNKQNSAVMSGNGVATSFTQTNGVIFVQRTAADSGSGLTIWILAGGYGQDVWNKP